MLLRVLCCIVAVLEAVNAASPSATIAQGELRGSWMRTRRGRQVAAFRGVPYAAPPIKKLRFKSPQPAKAWSGRKLAREDGNKCVQFHLFLGVNGEEDCLYLNIYTPKLDKDAGLPVLFFIHGGAFKTGSGGSFLYGPDYLLDEDLVLVTINYRLGVFGFLSLEDNVLPGNLGLKDQREALRWVRDNIRQFGGDPHKVTLFGESAGAISAHYHLLFNAEEGLFQAGILHSGSAYTAGGFQRPGEQKALVNHILNQTKCQADNSSSVIQCLQSVRPYKLSRVVHSFFLEGKIYSQDEGMAMWSLLSTIFANIFMGGFRAKGLGHSCCPTEYLVEPSFESLMRKVELSPVIEPECVEDAFITENPWNRNTTLPMIIGTNKYEAMFTIADIIKDDSGRLFNEMNTNYEKMIPYNLMFEESADDPTSVAKTLKQFYLQDNKIDKDHLYEFTNMLSDGMFHHGTVEAVKNNENNTYLFLLNYLGSKSFLNLLGLDNVYGPTHADDMFYFFSIPLLQTHRPANYFQAAELDRKLSEKLVKAYINFATDLNPSTGEKGLEWKPVSSSALEYLSIDGPDNLTMTSDYYSERIEFWQNLPFRNKPLPDLLPCEERDSILQHENAHDLSMI